MSGKYKLYFLSIFFFFAQLSKAMNDLSIYFQELIEILKNIDLELSVKLGEAKPQEPEKKPQEKKEEEKEQREIEKKQEATECFAGIKIIEAEMADFQKNEKDWRVARIQKVLDMIEKHRHSGCSYTQDIETFVKKLRQRGDELDPCTQQKEAIEILMKEFSAASETLPEDNLKTMKAEVDAFLKNCQSQASVADFYEKIKKALAGPEKNKQEEYEELDKELLQAARKFKKDPNSFTNEQLGDYKKKIDIFDKLYKDKNIIKSDADEAKLHFNAITAFKSSVSLSLGLGQIASSKKELKNLLASITKIKEAYLANPIEYIDKQTAIYEKKRDEELNQLISQMRKKGDEGIDELQAASLVKKPIEVFIEKNNVILKILAEIKRYKESSLSEMLQDDMIAFIKRLLSDAYIQIKTQKQNFEKNYATLLSNVHNVFKPELLLKLIEAYLAQTNLYKMYAAFFSVQTESDIDQIQQAIKAKKADALAALIDSKIKAGTPYSIDELANWFTSYKDIQTELGKPLNETVEENMKQVFNKKEKNILDTLSNEIILLVEPYQQGGTYQLSSIETSKINLILEKLKAFKQATDEYVQKTKDVSYANESLSRFKGLFQQLVLMIYSELAQKLKPYQKSAQKGSVIYDFSNINQADKKILFALFDAYRSRLEEYRNIVADKEFHSAILTRLNQIEQMLLQEVK